MLTFNILLCLHYLIVALLLCLWSGLLNLLFMKWSLMPVALGSHPCLFLLLFTLHLVKRNLLEADLPFTILIKLIWYLLLKVAFWIMLFCCLFKKFIWMKKKKQDYSFCFGKTNLVMYINNLELRHLVSTCSLTSIVMK